MRKYLKWLATFLVVCVGLAGVLAWWLIEHAPVFKETAQPPRPSAPPVPIVLGSSLPAAPEPDGTFINKDGNAEPCLREDQLVSLAGHWLTIRDVRALEQSREWLGAHSAHVEISPKGQAAFFQTWHADGEGRCLSLDGAQLYDHGRPGGAQAPGGPYVRIADAQGGSVATYVFNRVFRGECFEALGGDAAETWCLANGKVTITGVDSYATPLVLDPTDAPRYGLTMMSIWEDDKPMVLVPTIEGWDVYADDWLSSDDRESVGPGVSEPERRLRRLPPL